jgi:uncharacterized protein with LGFP repeats
MKKMSAPYVAYQEYGQVLWEPTQEREVADRKRESQATVGEQLSIMSFAVGRETNNGDGACTAD